MTRLIDNILTSVAVGFAIVWLANLIHYIAN